jgi:hypothetical protein
MVTNFPEEHVDSVFTFHFYTEYKDIILLRNQDSSAGIANG